MVKSAVDLFHLTLRIKNKVFFVVVSKIYCAKERVDQEAVIQEPRTASERNSHKVK